MFVCFLWAGYAALWMVLLIFWRDCLVAGLRGIAARQFQRIAGESRFWLGGRDWSPEERQQDGERSPVEQQVAPHRSMEPYRHQSLTDIFGTSP